MPRKQVTVDFDEIFIFAGDEPYKIGWNECCDIFHGNNEILCSPEQPNKTVYLGDIEASIEYFEEHPETIDRYSKDKVVAYPILRDFMKKHGLKEMLVLND